MAGWQRHVQSLVRQVAKRYEWSRSASFSTFNHAKASLVSGNLVFEFNEKLVIHSIIKILYSHILMFILLRHGYSNDLAKESSESLLLCMDLFLIFKFLEMSI